MGFFSGESGALGGITNVLFGGKTNAEQNLEDLSKAYYGGSLIQRFLPPALRHNVTGPILQGGVEQIGQLIRNPGGLSGSVSEAILPRLASESESIAQNYRGLQQEQAGAAARGNAPVSIKNALASALGIGEERAQREARRGALSESEQLRRTDVEQTYKLLDAILQFISSGRGQGVQGLAAASGVGQARQASNKQLFSDIIGSVLGGGIGG